MTVTLKQLLDLESTLVGHTCNITKEKIGFIIEKLSKSKQSSDWSMVKNYQTTLIKTDATYKNIMLNLNKLTPENFCKYKGLILDDVNLIKDIKLDELCSNIFTISSKNVGFSKVYVELINFLIVKNIPIKDLCISKFNEYINIFNDVEYVDPNENYDKFCELNKKNDMRKVLSVFFTNLMNRNIIPVCKIINILDMLLNIINKNLDNEKCKTLINEVSNNIKLIILHGTDVLKEEQTMNKIRNKIEVITKLDSTNHAGLTKKTLFTHMDILELI